MHRTTRGNAARLRAAVTGQDRNSRLVEFGIFRNAPAPDFSDPTKTVDPATIDLRLRADSPAIDAGTLLPGIADGCPGGAPDLGACEYGRELPQYGPRERGE